MTILGLKRSLFGSPTRRLLALVGANAAFYGGGYLIQRYIDEQASSPGLSFALVFFWMALGVTAALFTLISLGELLLHRGFIDRFLRDDLEGLDQRLALAERGIDPTTLAVDEADEAPMRYSPFRFGLLFLALTALNLVSANRLGGGFLQRYTHPGVAIVHLRSDDPLVRRNGLTMLTERLQIVATPAVAQAVLAMLDDPDEGVKARAAFVIGTLGIEAGAEPLAKLAVQNEALTFAALIALGQIREEGARKAILGIVDAPAVLREPRALAMALGLLRAPAIERLQAIFRQAGDDPQTRAAAIWALGQLREPRLLDFVAPALEDPELVVRCAAAEALELMAVFEASEPLRRAFEAQEDKLAQCPEVKVPVQEGGPSLFVVRLRGYLLALVRALHTTDDPELLRWYVAHQDGLDERTHGLMQKSWEALTQKDAEGRLNHLKKKIQLMKLRAGPESAAAPDSAAAPGSAAAPVSADAPGSAAAPPSAAPASAPVSAS